MFVSGQSVYAGLVFSLLSFLVAIPSAIKVFNWTATMYKGSISYRTPMLYALGFIGLFTIGGLTGLFLATLAVDVHVHDTYFVVAHFHYIMVGGAVMGYLGGLHFWWPKMTGRMYPEGWAKLAGADHFRRLQPDVLPAIPARLSGHAAALSRLPAGVPGAQRHVHGRRDRSSALGYLLPMIYLIWSLRCGAGRGPEPVGRRGAGVADPLAAADRQLRGDARGDPGGLRLRKRGLRPRRRAPPCPLATPPFTRRPRRTRPPPRMRSWPITSTTSPSNAGLANWACGRS